MYMTSLANVSIRCSNPPLALSRIRASNQNARKRSFFPTKRTFIISCLQEQLRHQISIAIYLKLNKLA